MGAASCKNAKLTTQIQPKDDKKNITIGVFGLDDAGKTSTVKVIEGDPTDDVTPTISSISTIVINPLNENNDRNNKNKDSIKIIDVSGERKFRQKSWPQYYDQIHGLIYVIDASEKERLNENQEILEDLLRNEKLKNKPVLILANKQDQRGAITSEYELKRTLEIEKLKTKYKIELCTAIPRNHKYKGDESIRKGFTWLIRTINDNYLELNARITKTNNTRTNRKFNRSDSDENISDNKYTKENNTDYRSRITSEKLPSLITNKNQTKLYNNDDNDDNYPSSTNDLNKKKKVLGGTASKEKSIKKSNDNEPKAFRSTYESFPEETPWSSASIVKPSKSDDMLPRLYTKPLVTNDTKRRDMSPLVHDTKSYTNGSISKRNNYSDDEDHFDQQQKSKSINRFDSATFPSNKFSTNTKGVTSNIYDDDYNTNNYRRANTAPNKSYNRDDDNDYNKNYQRPSSRSNLNSDYRGTLSKPTDYSKYDDDDDNYSTSKSKTRSTYNNDYSTSKSTNRSKYDDDDDDDDNRGSSSKTKSHSKFDDDDYPTSKPTIRSKSNDNNYPSSFSKSTNRTKYDDDDDDDYRSSPSKAVTRSKYSDDDDDDYYTNSSTKNNHSSSYNGNTSRFRSENDDFFTKGGTNNTNRFRKNTDYDS